ncbi:MAG: universal stress protein [Candidatus Auribacterota bacterium]|jgi:nucleotide-binding universal stress UspA family protein|uniref:Universal stress protein n=1 Tax=Candidatus Auribacter fodinae TaxID=2093366 RepID=A0A3A4R4E6_9BACT|nr:MAG: universal stress protein [Candidatus Auribacter fodinae]
MRINPPDMEAAMVNFKHILYPTDFSPYSTVALDYCISLAHKYQSKISILHVVEVFLPDPEYLTLYGEIDTIYKQFEKDAEKRMASLLEKNQFKKLDISSHIIIGKPFIEIIQFSRNNNTDLIVMGSHGKSALSHILFGSTADKVVTKASCPVLIVKHPEHTFVMP